MLDMLTEEECYLWAILSDESGLDQAEFMMIDESQPDGCFRAWPFQWPWFRCNDPKQIDQGARSAGKSLSIKLRALAFPFVHPGQEMVITAPEGNHLDAITDKIESTYEHIRLLREMLIRGRTGIKHRPFHVSFRNGARIMGRIPQRTGVGMKGMHPIWLELDEGQDYPEAGWNETLETILRGSDFNRWRVHGVTRGVVDKFYKFTQPDSGWKVHWLPAMYRPNWTDEERQEKMKDYGHRDNPDYRRNILGLHGDAASPLFVFFRLMAAADHDISSDYNANEYDTISIDEAAVRDYGSILPLLKLSKSHDKYQNFWIGADIGYTQAPTAIVVFAEDKTTKGGDTKLRLLARIILKKVAHEDQVAAIMYLINEYRPIAFAMDKTGLGLPLFQDIQNHAKKDPELAHIVDRIKGYGFSEKIVVDYDDTVEIDETDPESYKKAEIKKNVLEYSSDCLRGLVDEKRLILPWDTDLLGEFQGQTWTYEKSTVDMYGRRKSFSQGSFHTLDACRMAVLAYKQNAIEQMLKAQENVWEIAPTFFLD